MLYEISETLKHSHGTYTDQTIQRAGKIVGPLASSLDHMFMKNVGELNEKKTSQNRQKLADSVAQLSEEYKDDKLFSYIPGRHHKSYKAFKVNRTVKNAKKLKTRLLQYSKRLDVSREILP